ncbi:MAG: hypothetical protein QOH48_1038 [Actinomycetota bacterium]|jgi:hypothetical protein|nr:hypothetical protein [Actinomycetota bacterium]
MKSKGRVTALGVTMVMSSVLLAGALTSPVTAAPKRVSSLAKYGTGGVQPASTGMLDCNGFSSIQRSVKLTSACADPRGYDGGRFYDNGHYIGHDEPIVRFLSNRAGSGNHTVWKEKLPLGPNHRPTVNTPGNDITHWFELSVAPWFSMALCNSRSYPLTQPCTPNRESNAPSATSPGAGSSFLEMQFYPPGYAPFVDNISCDNTHWCASLHINDLECDTNFICNPQCVEPTNFAFIQKDGVPTGPPSPQLSNLASFTPNAQTLLMNPGDKIVARVFDADIGGGKHALETRIRDVTTGESGYMIASAKNGFMATNPGDCTGVPFNYEPEYRTASPANVIPWAALQTNISTQFEIGHFTPCSTVQNPVNLNLGGATDTMWQNCTGPYEQAGRTAGLTEEPNDSPCYPEGYTHHGLAAPNLVTGCDNFFAANGDLDFDGSSYWPDWPSSTTPNRHPSPFLQREPKSRHALYKRIQFQTDAAASEASCKPTGVGCAVPPPGAPGHFYPWWTLAKVHGRCVWEFGQMTNGNSFGKTAQYGQPALSWYYGNLEGRIKPLPSC